MLNRFFYSNSRVEVDSDYESNNDDHPIVVTITNDNKILSKSLTAFIESTRNNNELLGDHFIAKDHHLYCPILSNFPQIPVRFNGRLYDYQSLMLIENNGIITDPITFEKIKLSEHTIQPDYDAQKRMDELHVKLQEKNSRKRKKAIKEPAVLGLRQ